MISVPNTVLDERVEENYFSNNLQSLMSFTLGKKIIREGRLIIFKRTHYFFQITILNHKNQTECFEIPLPFVSEYHSEDNLLYLDYRIKTLAGNDRDIEIDLLKQTEKTSPSQFFNKILEIHSAR